MALDDRLIDLSSIDFKATSETSVKFMASVTLTIQNWRDYAQEIDSSFTSLLNVQAPPSNALSVPTWGVHVFSLVEWLVAMGFVWDYGTRTQHRGWKLLTLAMLPLHASGICAVTQHFFNNDPSLEWLVALQGAFTMGGNISLFYAAKVLANEEPKLDFLLSTKEEEDDANTENFQKYLSLAKIINPKYISIPKAFGLDMISEAKKYFKNEMLVGVRVKKNDDTSDIESYLEMADFVMVELDSKKIRDEKIVERAKQKNCEPIYLAKMPTLMKGQVQSRDENFEIGHTLEDGFDIVALYEETAHGPYAARSVKCIDEIAVESEKLRVNPFGDLLDKFLGFLKR